MKYYIRVDEERRIRGKTRKFQYIRSVEPNETEAQNKIAELQKKGINAHLYKTTRDIEWWEYNPNTEQA